MRGRDRPAPSRPENYGGWSHVTNNRCRGATLISLSPEMTTNGCIRISRYSGMRPALAASASREHFALLLVALHHIIDHLALDRRSRSNWVRRRWTLAKTRATRNQSPNVQAALPGHEDAQTSASSFRRTDHRFLLCFAVNLARA
jgi:hypothetical protein